MALPALIKVPRCFALILALSRCRLHLSLCLMVAAIALGAWLGLSPGRIVASIAALDLSHREKACFEASLPTSYPHLYRAVATGTGI